MLLSLLLLEANSINQISDLLRHVYGCPFISSVILWSLRLIGLDHWVNSAAASEVLKTGEVFLTSPVPWSIPTSG